jgi:hypothetical protein
MTCIIARLESCIDRFEGHVIANAAQNLLASAWLCLSRRATRLPDFQTSEDSRKLRATRDTARGAAPVRQLG